MGHLGVLPQSVKEKFKFKGKKQTERKKIYNEADYRIKCSFLTSNEIVNKILKLYEKSGN